jgi:tetratricopeptide (TPR) repeat protein
MSQKHNQAVHRYTRADLLRILRVTARQLASWEKAGLIATAENYSFFDLLQIKKVRDLCARKVRPAVIRESLQAMQKQVAGMENPLVEAGAYGRGARVVFRHDGKTVEPIAGQFVMDFAPRDNVVSASMRPRLPETRDAEQLFARGIALEEDPATQQQAIAIYEQVLQIDGQHAAAHINLGTIYYNRQDYAAAEKHYRAAVEVDARYALAYFDLGNVLDETGRVVEAIKAYETALLLASTYADAHYNLALAYEKIKQPRKALAHWRAYVRLDNSGPWSLHATNQMRRIMDGDVLRIVYRRK